MKHHNQEVDFSNLDFETINTEILVDEAKEQEEATTIATREDNAMDAKRTDQGHEVEDVATP